jgi:hypothetical protein
MSVENIIIAQPSSDPFMKKCFLKKMPSREGGNVHSVLEFLNNLRQAKGLRN